MKSVSLKKRPDVKAIVDLDDVKFEWWYHQRREALTRLLGDYRLFAGIPNLNYPDALYSMSAITCVRDQLDALYKASKSLKAIREFRDRRKAKEKKNDASGSA
jgi:hypothetical protein